LRGDYSDLTVIIPTLNEKSNITKLIGILTRMYRNVSMIVSDDGSDDGTRERVRALGRRNRRIRLLDRSRKSVHGLTASVIDAAMMTGTGKIVVMDGDLQHPPSKVGDIARALDRYDIVVGVRTSVREWGISRRMISKGMAYLAYVLFAISGRKRCNDMMSGFFGIRTKEFKELVASQRSGFVEEGYKVLLDILRLMDRSGSLGEVRYSTFHLRKEGKSKLGIKHAITTLRSTVGWT